MTTGVEKAAAIGVGVAASGAVGGSIIGAVNEYLQAAAFVAAIFSGIAAGVYYLRKK